jgi:lipoprotein-anchoring transpeptidase ErfK/SrfK
MRFFRFSSSSFFSFVAFAVAVLLLSQCTEPIVADRSSKILVSVRDQKLLLTQDGVPVKTYPISTSKFGVGTGSGSNRTPLGQHAIAKKIGHGSPSGMVFKSRRPTGEVLRPNAPGRDPIVSRILWLYGKERHNRNTYRRCVYIHGTPEEWRIGSPASYGCIRMSSKDVIDLYNRVGVGADVEIMRSSLPSTSRPATNTASASPDKKRIGS